MHRNTSVPSVPVLVAAALLAAASPATGQAPREIVARAARAAGGEEVLRRLRSITADYHVTTFSLGQSETAESPPRATVAYGRVTTDVAASRRSRAQEARTIGGPIVRTWRVTSGGIGLLEIDGRQAPDGAGAVFGIERAMRREPDRILLAAFDNPSALRPLPARAWRGEQHDGVAFQHGADTLSLYFDRRSGLLTVVETVTDDPILGDRSTAIWYTRWQAAGAVLLPRQVDAIVNSQLQEHWVFTGIVVDAADAGAFNIPDSIAARAQRAPAPGSAPPPVSVTLAGLGPGLWRAEGGSHHSLVIEQPGGLVVVEAPQNRARMQAVLDTLAARFPGRRVTLLVNTHHHWDHAGGLRTVMANGIPVLTHARNAAFVRQVASARKTVAPDELSRRSRTPAVRTLEDSLVLGDGDSRAVVYSMNTVHAEGLVGVWVPGARVLFTSDVLNPGPTLNQAGSAELVAFARSRGLAPERYAGGHGQLLAWADVERAAAGR